MNDTDAPVFSGIFIAQLPGAVLGAVVYQKQFKIGKGLP